jgi:hypothetical protein
MHNGRFWPAVVFLVGIGTMGGVMPKLQIVLNGLIAGFVIVVVSEIARRFPRLGALILTLPLVIPAVFVVTYLRERSILPITRLSRNALIIIPLTLPFYVPLAFAGRMNLSFWPALALGLVLLAAAVAVYLVLAPKGL